MLKRCEMVKGALIEDGELNYTFMYNRTIQIQILLKALSSLGVSKMFTK